MYSYTRIYWDNETDRNQSLEIASFIASQEFQMMSSPSLVNAGANPYLQENQHDKEIKHYTLNIKKRKNYLLITVLAKSLQSHQVLMVKPA